MQNIRVQFTIPNVEKVAIMDVSVNGERRNMKFRVEAFPYDSAVRGTTDLVEFLREKIENYDDDWELYHIGTPHDETIPVTFRHK